MMKYLPIILAALAAVSCGGPKPVETPAQKLHAKLSQSVKDGKILYGHQDDLAYGHAWKVEDWEADPLDRSDVKAVTGKYPAVMGVELGGIEMSDRASLDSVDFGLIRKAAKLHAERGGVVTVSWHPRNPLTGGDAYLAAALGGFPREPGGDPGYLPPLARVQRELVLVGEQALLG